MTESIPCQAARESFGVLVLGAIDPLERDVIEGRVFSCPDCAATLAEFSSLPGMLKRLDGDRLATEEPPAHLLDKVIRQVRTESTAQRSRARRSRRAGVAVLAVAAIAALVLAVAVTQKGISTPTSVSAPVASAPAATPASQTPNGPASATDLGNR